MFDLEFYTLPNGKKPAEEFILGLEPKMQTKAMTSLELLRENGSTIKEPFSKPIGNGLFELRIKFSSDISRIFYFFCIGKKIIVTSGFIKKTQKTPPSEIEKAQKYKSNFERRNKNG